MSSPQVPQKPQINLLIPAFVFLTLLLGCSAADLVQRDVPTPTPSPTREVAPTFTPTATSVSAVIIITPPAPGTPGVIIVPEGMDPSLVIPVPTATPPPSFADSPQLPPGTPAPGAPGVPAATPVPLPIDTPSATSTLTPVPTPTPYIVVQSGLVNLRQGPGVEYPLVAQLGPDIPVAIIGQNPEGTWFQICCVSGEAVWVAKSHVAVGNDPTVIALVAPDPPPTATPTGTPTITPTPTATATATRYPFERARGPEFFPTNNEFLTIWANMFVQPDPQKTPDPASGYFLQVLYEGFERPPTNEVRPSADSFFESAPAGAGNRVIYNYKYEYTPPDPKTLDCNTLPQAQQTACRNRTLTKRDLIGTGTWTVFVIDGAGNQLSDEVTFVTAPSNPNREVYIGWNRIR